MINYQNFTISIILQVKDTEISDLDFWKKPIELLAEMVSLVKKEPVFSGRAFLGPLLKYSRIFLDSFVRNGMPLMDR